MPEYPLLLPLWTMHEARLLAAIPVLDGDASVGAMGWRFSEAQRFDDEQRTMLVAMASECAAMLAKPAT